MGIFSSTPGQPGPMRPDEFKGGSVPNLVTFRIREVGPPSPLYIQRDDQLVLWGASSTAGEVIVLTARMLLAAPSLAGQPDSIAKTAAEQLSGPGMLPIVTIRQSLSLPTIFTQGFISSPLAEGYLLSVTAFANVSNQRGQAFCRVRIDRGTPVFAATNSAQILIADYVSGGIPATWPGGRVLGPTESTGAIVTISPANPTVGSDLNFSTGGLSRSRLQALAATLVTSGTVATRTARLRIVDSAGNLIYQAPPTQTQPASTTAIYSAAQGQVTPTTDPTTINWAFPGLIFISGGYAIQTNTLNIQAGDQWSLARLSIEQWIDIL